MSIAVIAALALLRACAPGTGADTAPVEPSVATDEPAEADTLEVAAAGDALPDLWEARLADLADATRPHASRWGSARAFARAESDLSAALAARLSGLLGPEDVRYYAVRAIGFLGDPSAAPALLPHLTDAAWTQRRYVALALEQVGDDDPATIRALETALADPLPAVRDQSRRALGRLPAAAARPALDRWYLDGHSTGLTVDVTPPEPGCFPAACRLRVRLTNTTDHVIELPPLLLSLERGLYLRDAADRASWPWAGDEHRGEGAPLDPVRVESGATAEVQLTLSLEPHRTGLPIDHGSEPAPDRWALRVGQIRYLLHPDNNPGGSLGVRIVLHPAFTGDLTKHLARASAFWTGKAVGEEIPLILPPLPETSP